MPATKVGGARRKGRKTMRRSRKKGGSCPLNEAYGGKRRGRKPASKKRGGATAKKTVTGGKRSVKKVCGTAKKTTSGGKKRKLSAYNQHVKAEMKKGKSMADAAKSWRAKKK